MGQIPCSTERISSFVNVLIVQLLNIGYHVSGMFVGCRIGRAFEFDENTLKRSFYAARNSIFSHSDGISKTTVLNLQEAYSLSVLMYASPALALESKQINELNASWNNVIRRIFGYQ